MVMGFSRDDTLAILALEQLDIAIILWFLQIHKLLFVKLSHTLISYCKWVIYLLNYIIDEIR